MKRYYCNGKKDFCDRDRDCDESYTQDACEFFDETGGEEITEDEGEEGKDE